MILTVTPNPALDVTYTLAGLVPGSTHSVANVRERAGGKGLNVASVLAGFGSPVVASGPLGGAGAQAFAEEVRTWGVSPAFVDSPAPTRRSIAVVARGEATVLNELGVEQPATVWDGLVDTVCAHLGEGDVLAVSGSLPPSAPEDLVRRLVVAANAAHASSVLDVRGAALRAALDARPTIVTPNAGEAAETTGLDDPVLAGESLVELGAHSAVISCGAEGLVLVAPVLPHLTARLPEPLHGNATGAGDAKTAALCARLDGQPAASVAVNDRAWWEQTLRVAVAWSAAAVLQPVAGIVDPADVTRLLPTVDLEELP